MRPRQINYMRHDLFAKQALAIALECWSENRREPIILITPKGKAQDVAKNIRVILAKEKAKRPKDERVAYGFTLSTPFPYSDKGVKGEAIILRWRLTATQNLKNLFNFNKEESNGGHQPIIA